MKTLMPALALLLMLIGAQLLPQRIIAGENNTGIHYSAVQPDTTRPGSKNQRNKKNNDFTTTELDEAMKSLDLAMSGLDKSMKIDMDRMEKELKMAMQELKKVDMEKVQREINAAMKEVDWKKIKEEIHTALREVDVKMSKEEREEMEKEIAKARKDIEKVKLENSVNLEKIKTSVKKGMESARTGIEKAKTDLTRLKEFTQALEKDGLIDSKKGYVIEVKKGELYLNGVKQSKEISDKYRPYFKDKDDDFTIRSGKGQGVTI
jgi:bla regulator protein BlaR1